MEKIILKIKELKENLEKLKEAHYSKGRKEFYSILSLLDRIIDRTYPEKDAKDIKKKLHRTLFIYTGKETDGEKQQEYLRDIDRAIRVIETITEEYNLLGFDDFKPIKEKVETEVQVGSDKIGFWRRKKSN